jgi:hypothetical protein
VVVISCARKGKARVALGAAAFRNSLDLRGTFSFQLSASVFVKASLWV